MWTKYEQYYIYSNSDDVVNSMVYYDFSKGVWKALDPTSNEVVDVYITLEAAKRNIENIFEREDT